MSERRFTDQEVTRILQRATELDHDGGPVGSARGLTVRELQDIGHEVGISAELIARAASELDPSRDLRPTSIYRAPVVQREVRSVPGRLTSDDLAQLVRIIDEQVPAQGTVTEALNTVRWTSGGRRLSRQVSLEPHEDETLIRVEERFGLRIRRAITWIPTVYAGFLAAAVSMNTAGFTLGGFGLALALMVSVWVVASVIWYVISERSHQRVHDLTEALSSAATRLAAEHQGSRAEPDTDDAGTDTS